MPSSNSTINGNRVLLAGISFIAGLTATATVLCMGQPENITSDTGAQTATEQTASNSGQSANSNDPHRVVGHVQTSDLAEAYPPPADCMTDQGEGFTEFADGALLIESTGCSLDPETFQWFTGDTRYDKTAEVPDAEPTPTDDSETSEDMTTAEDGSQVPESFYDDTDYEPVYP